MRINKILMLALAIIVSLRLQAQNELQEDNRNDSIPENNQVQPNRSNSVIDQLIKPMVHPSPQSAAYARYGEYPVGHSTGVPHIEIPLYTLNTGDFQLPISISYHASGIKVSDVSSPVGLGWVLNAGGVITRTVCGAPDFSGPYYQQFFKNKSDVEQRLSYNAMDPSLWNRVFNNSAQYDSESDRYSYNFHGNSGIFCRDVYTEQFFPIPHDPIKIEHLSSGFKITDTSGSEFYFEVEEYCSPPSSDSHISAWYLNKIVTGCNRNTITFTYGQRSSYQMHRLVETLDHGGYLTYEDQGYGTLVPVDHPGAVSNSNSRTDIYGYSVPLLTSIKWNDVEISLSYYSDRQDEQSERLGAISIKDNNSDVRYISFGNNASFGNSRLKLNSISIKGSQNSSENETYSFTYNDGTYNTNGNLCIEDYWGYYNGANTVSRVPNGLLSGQPTTNRIPNPNLMKAHSLTSIIYPTGGSTSFNLEANKIGNVYYGGLRIKEINNLDAGGALLSKQSFEYSNGEPSIMITDDLFMFTDDFWYYTRNPNNSFQSYSYTHEVVLSSSVIPLTGWSGAPVFYSNITEFQGNNQGYDKKTEYTYIQDIESDYPGAEEDDNSNTPPLRLYSTIYNNFEGNVPALLSSKKVYNKINNNYNLQLSETYGYDELIPPHDSITIGVRIGRMGIGIINYENDQFSCAPYPDMDTYYSSIVYTNVRGYRKLRKLASIVTTDHERNMSSVKSFSYDPQTHGLLPISESVVNSDGATYKTQTFYPYQMNGGVYGTMTANNYIDIPIKTEKYKGSQLVETEQTTYTTSGNMYLPSSVQRAIGNGSLRTLGQFLRYDAHGNPQHISSNDGRQIVILWGYNYRYPIAVIEGMGYSAVEAALGSSRINSLASSHSVSMSQLNVLPGLLPGAHVSLYSYSPSVGIASETSLNTYCKTYLYDALGRLVRISDNMGILETYNYHYR